MGMDNEDARMVNTEEDTSPQRWASYDPNHTIQQRYETRHPAPPTTANGEEIEQRPSVVRRNGSQISSSTASSSFSSATRHGDDLREVQSTESQARPNVLRGSTTQQDQAVYRFLERHPTAMKRIDDHRLQHSQTVGSTRSRKTNKELPPFGHNKKYPPQLPDSEEYIVEFDGPDDPKHPQNWPLKKKIAIFTILVFTSLTATLASSIFSPAATAVGTAFSVGQEVTTLGTSLFVLGYAFGPIFWAPMSELYGRRPPILISATGMGIFLIAVAVAKDIQTVMICRFFAGLFGSCALTIVPAIFSDMFNNKYRGVAIAGFTATVFNGPLTGPMIGGFVTKSYLGWRWTMYIPSFMAFTCAVMALFFLEESYAPVILVSKASELRRLTRNWGVHARQEEIEVDMKELISKNIGRPMRILFGEPIVLLVSFYMSFLYGILYLSLTAYSITFGQIYGMSPGVSGLPYIGMIVGVMVGFVTVVSTNPGYVKKLEANDDVPVPEWRLFFPILGGISFAIGLFWFGWTGFTSDIPWVVPTLAGLCLGFGIYTVFLQLLNYILDSYLMFAASAMAANTFMRSMFGAIFPLFATYMYNGIGINWGMTLLGCIATLLIPMPITFYFFGKRIRAKSTFAPAPDLKKERREKGQQDEESGQATGSGEENGEGEKKQD